MVSLVLVLAAAACHGGNRAAVDRTVLLLGFDGLDPVLLERFLAAGDLPNFARFLEHGSFRRLATTVPPQSPVAWSTFITGLDPGGHGIYDFIHRDPKPPGRAAILPYFSTSHASDDDLRLPLGNYEVPLRSGTVELLRRGRAFWNVLADHAVPATIVKIPANFPPEPSDQRTLSDMGTPDLRGTYGTFFLFTSDPDDGEGREVSGGIVYVVAAPDDRVRGEIPGPHSFRKDKRRATAPFEVYLDRASRAAKIEVGGEQLIVRAGEWSGWVPLRFELLPYAVSAAGMVRFHLSAIEPHFRLYVTPVNVDPRDPSLPISTPPEYAQDLADRVGPFYTQGIPELSSSLTAGALDDRRWLRQVDDIFEERLTLFEAELWRLREGLLYVYFGGVDQVSHMFWRALDRPDDPHADAIRKAYQQLDRVVGRVLDAAKPEWRIAILSDHGFAPFDRAVHLNRWLASRGYLTLRRGAKTSAEIFRDVDWSKTRAYGLGLNGLYLNVRGREKYGVVVPEEREALAAEIQAELLAWRDPANGQSVVARADRREDVYRAPRAELAPDLVIGYQRGYRVSNESALGEIPEATIERNEKKWSGDHCIAADQVPGVLLSNRPLADRDLALEDVAPTVLREFGIQVPNEMTGRPFFAGEN